MNPGPGQTLLHYKLVAKLGEGGMGEVWVAEDGKLNRRVALKILPPDVTDNVERRARFEREAQTVAALNHPNIVTLYSVEVDRDLHFLTMELVDGETLADCTPRHGFALGKLLDLAVPLADAVSAAHDKGIVHRDLKPANVIVGKDGRIRVLDFGLAKLREETPAAGEQTQLPTQSITQDGRIVGTVAYMSPEQAEGKTVDARSDVFALGVVLYEMATGRRPFRGDTTVSTITSIIRDTPESVTDLNQTLPRHFGRIVRRCLTKDPRRRYQTALELHNELLELKEELESGELEVPSGTPAAIAARRSRWLWPVVAVVGLLVVVALVRFWPARSGTGAGTESFQRMSVEQLTTDGITTDAAISPDGNYMVRSLRTATDPPQFSLRVRQLATGTEVEVVAPQTKEFDMVGFTPDGSYALYGWTDLYRIPVLGGTPRKIVEDMQGYYTFSPDGTKIAYSRGVDRESRLVITTLDGSEDDRVLATRTTPESIGSPAWSPDGRTIVFVVARWRPINSASFWTIPAMGGEERPIGDEWIGLRHTVWLPDGTGFLALANDTSQMFGDQIWLFPYPAGNPSRITNDAVHYDDLSITRDGGTIVATKYEWETGIWLAPADSPDDAHLIVPESTSAPGIFGASLVSDGRIVYGASDLSLWVTSGDGGGSERLTPRGESDFDPGWIRGTERIVFQSNAGGEWNAWVMDLDGGNRQPLLEGVNFDIAADPAGEWIYYRSVEGGGTVLWRVPVDGGDPERLHDHFVVGYMVPPDGERIAVGVIDRDSGEFRTEIMTIGGNSSVPFPLDEGSDHMAWSPGGEITYQTGLWGDVWAISPDGGEPHRLTHFEKDYTVNWEWSPDGESMFFVRGRVRDDALMIRDFR
jgi:Tol biopolymer transport system component